MSEKKTSKDQRTEEIITAFDRERSEARELIRRHADAARNARERDRQVLIERRRQPC